MTHIIVDKNDLDRIEDLRLMMEKTYMDLQKIPHVVDKEWIDESYNNKTLMAEENFVIRPLRKRKNV